MEVGTIYEQGLRIKILVIQLLCRVTSVSPNVDIQDLTTGTEVFKEFLISISLQWAHNDMTVIKESV